jgi:hypothetical protein
MSIQSLEEVVVYDGVAECTGVQFERKEVRRMDGYCRSLSALLRKARAAGDGTFYLPLDQWPTDIERLDLRKPWVVLP